MDFGSFQAAVIFSECPSYEVFAEEDESMWVFVCSTDPPVEGKARKYSMQAGSSVKFYMD